MHAHFCFVACGGRFFSPNGVITSPGYPELYGSNMDCAYTIKVPSGKQVHLDIKGFELEQSPSCDYDFLEIRFARISFI